MDTSSNRTKRMVYSAYKFLPWVILLLSAQISEHKKYISRSTPLQQGTEAVHIVEPLLSKSLLRMGLWLSTFIPAYTFVAAVLLFTFLDQQSTCRPWHCLYSESLELSCWAAFKVTQVHHKWCHKGQIVLSVWDILIWHACKLQHMSSQIKCTSTVLVHSSISGVQSGSN